MYVTCQACSFVLVLVRAMRGTANLQEAAQVNLLSIHQRFYVTLALNELVNEVPLYKVAKKYNCTKGMLQSLQVKNMSFFFSFDIRVLTTYLSPNDYFLCSKQFRCMLVWLLLFAKNLVGIIWNF